MFNLKAEQKIVEVGGTSSSYWKKYGHDSLDFLEQMEEQ